jgi:hypothetical protein
LDAYASQIRGSDERRASTIGASEIGQCARKLFYAKNAGDPFYAIQRDAGYADAWGAQLRGSTFERAFWVPALRAKYGGRLKFAGDEQRSFESDFLSATPDGLLTDAPADILAPLGIPDIRSDCLLLEAKTVDPRTKLDGPKPEHRFQVIVQLGLVREVTDFAPRYAVISYADASFWSEITEFVVEFDPAVYENAKRRAAKVLTASRASELSPEGYIAGGRECDYCAFAKACGIERRPMPEASAVAVDPQFATEARDLAREVKHRQAEVDAATVRLRETQNEIRERLRAKGLRRINGDDFSIVWSPVKGRESFDVKALKAAAIAAGIDVTKFSTIGEPTDRLDIRVREHAFQEGNLDHDQRNEEPNAGGAGTAQRVRARWR